MAAAELEPLLEMLIAASAPLSAEIVCERLSLSKESLTGLLGELRSLEVPVRMLAGGLALDCPDALDAGLISAGLSGLGPPPYVEVRRMCESTNIPAAHGVVPALYLAELQTAGRGRRGNAWRQPFASGLAFSFATRIDVPRLDGLALALAVAVAATLETLGYAGIRLKWPNDLYFADAKLGGLMIQAAGSRPSRLVVGLGINVHATPRLDDRATTSLAAISDAGISRNALAAELTCSLSRALERFVQGGLAVFVDEYKRLDLLAGRAVSLTIPQGRVSGIVRGIGAKGEIAIETASGLQHFAAGEVSIGHV